MQLPTSLPAPSGDATAVEDAQLYRGVLHELIAMGTDIARSVHRRIMAADATGTWRGPDLTVAFDRVARAVRRTVVLAHALEQAAAAVVERRAAMRREVLRTVEDTIQRRAPGEAVEGLETELHERLERPEFAGELDRPVADVIADICRDLGLVGTPGSAAWKRRTPEAYAALCERAADVVCAPVRRPWVVEGEVEPGGAMVTPPRPRFRGG